MRNKILAIIGLIIFLLFWSATLNLMSSSLNYPKEFAWFFGFIPIIILLMGLAKAYSIWRK